MTKNIRVDELVEAGNDLLVKVNTGVVDEHAARISMTALFGKLYNEYRAAELAYDNSNSTLKSLVYRIQEIEDRQGRDEDSVDKLEAKIILYRECLLDIQDFISNGGDDGGVGMITIINKWVKGVL
jgi:hypothetical protein